MGQCHNFSLSFKISPPPKDRPQILVSFNPISLLRFGLTFPVIISTASVFRAGDSPEPLKSMLIMAHFDTGASNTTIDQKLANEMGLHPIGQATQQTAGGPINTPTFAIDLNFPNTTLASFINLQINSCILPFDLEKYKANQYDKSNFGLLIGRDVMSRWNIVWNGPTSNVFISD